MEQNRLHQSRIQRKWIAARIEGHAKREALFWMITFKGNDRAIGSICFWNFDPTFHSAEIGYELHHDFWSKGVMSEALSAVINYGFNEMDLHRIEGLPIAKNEPSKRLLLKLGFKLEGTFRERIFFRGKYEDQLILGLIRTEWKNRKVS